MGAPQQSGATPGRLLLQGAVLAFVPALLVPLFMRLAPHPLAAHRGWALAGFVLSVLALLSETAALHRFYRTARAAPFWPALVAALGLAAAALFWFLGLFYFMGSFTQYWLHGADPFAGWR